MEKTLFEKLGGTPGITGIVEDVVAAHMSNPRISARFLPYKEQPEKMKMIMKHTVDFFSAGSGGSVNYTGRDMVTAHRGMNISPEEFMCAVDDILLVLDNHKIDAGSKYEVLAILWSLKNMVIAQ